MSEKLVLSLSQMGAGQSGIVVQVAGGQGMMWRLAALGIRPGKRITKVSSMLFRGPVTVRIDNSQVAIGFGVASRVMVEVDAAS